MPVEAAAVEGSSPHTRGALARFGRILKIEGIIPAYAGSTSSYPTCDLPRTDHPRIRGEHYVNSVYPALAAGSSPHTRGARPVDGHVAAANGIIPAYAGSTHLGASMCTSARDHPRIRGEHDRRVEALEDVGGSSPHTRGARSRVRPCLPAPRIIPAYAGSTRLPARRRRRRRDHPRIRGEHRQHRGRPEGGRGSSPHTRGARKSTGRPTPNGRIIPAYAGSTPHGMIWIAWIPDHPRIRGEHFRGILGCAQIDGSSPHTRGAPGLGAVVDPEGGIIPAYAGSTVAPREVAAGVQDHPRIRGEHPQQPWNPVHEIGSSPHTRGARLLWHNLPRRPRIIPAYAGSTVASGSRSHPRADHPRIRGEHWQRYVADVACEGSSPHTRGALPHEKDRFLLHGIIPAYAGSTSAHR